MPKKVSAGVLMYRWAEEPDGSRRLEVLLVHPGGPYFAKKDAGAWSIPKGEVEPDERDAGDRPARGRLARGARGDGAGAAGAVPAARRRQGAPATRSSTPGPRSTTATPRPSSATRSRWSGRRARAGRRSSPRSTGPPSSTLPRPAKPSCRRSVASSTSSRRSSAVLAVGRGRPLTAQTIVILTSSGHTVTMETVSVAQLKARLSEYLRRVEAGERVRYPQPACGGGRAGPLRRGGGRPRHPRARTGHAHPGGARLRSSAGPGVRRRRSSCLRTAGTNGDRLHRFVCRSTRAPGPGRLSGVMVAPDGGCLVGAHRGGVPARGGQASSQRRARPGGGAEASSRRVRALEEPGDRPALSAASSSVPRRRCRRRSTRSTLCIWRRRSKCAVAASRR